MRAGIKHPRLWRAPTLMTGVAVRIPSAVARSARFVVGQPVELSVGEEGVLVKPAGAPKLTLAQKLAAFDPARHCGEAMAVRTVGKEVL